MTDRGTKYASAAAAVAMWAALGAASDAAAQGCMATRVSPPMFGSSGEGRYLEAGRWEMSVVARRYEAEKHFYEDNERNLSPAPRVERSILDASLTRMLDSRISLTLSVPFSDGQFDRSPIPAPVYQGAIDKATGIGDIALVARRWMFDPATYKRGNLRVGLGLKAPTGSYKQVTDRTFNGQSAAGEADIAVQPGDGGWGIVTGAEGFHHFSDHMLLFGEGAYILNPRGSSDHNNQQLGPGPYVPNTRTSVPDYFLARAGLVLGAPLGWTHGSAQLGLRLEGQPVRDILGSNEGFRRPGHTLAVEPGLAHAFRNASVYLSVPITVYRVRPKSVDEEARAAQNALANPGTTTNAVSAAFADVNVIVGFSYRLR